MDPGTERAIATVALVVVTASLPFYLYGAWVVLRVETVTWAVLRRHLAFIGIGLLLTTAPILAWMLPRTADRFDGYTALHGFLGVQAFALLAFALTGIVRIFQAKRAHDLYHDPDRDVDLDELHPDMGAWRFRLRVGVFGYLLFWLGAWLVGTVGYVRLY